MSLTNKDIADEYVNSILNGTKIACKELILTCKRYQQDLLNEKYYLSTDLADDIIFKIEHFFVHLKGTDVHGNSLMDKPVKLEPWQKFIIYNLVGLRKASNGMPKYNEAFILVPRKNGKTTFSADLMWALGLESTKSKNSLLYIVSNSLRQSLETFYIIRDNLVKKDVVNKQRKKNKLFTIIDNNNTHSIESTFGKKRGSFKVFPMASDTKRHDGVNANYVVCDEIHAFTNPKQYTIFRQAQMNYADSLLIGISTAGDNINGFCYDLLELAKKVLDGLLKQESWFIFICKADEDERGNVDYTNPIEHEKANPNYNVSISPDELMELAVRAEHLPSTRSDFLQKHLNIFTNVREAYFNIMEFKSSDRNFSWKIEDEIFKDRRLYWYGGADLAALHDLTAISLVTMINDVLVIYSHAFFPKVQADQKALEHQIPFHGWAEDGHLTMPLVPTMNYSIVVDKFTELRNLGLQIRQIGYDRKFAPDFVKMMRKNSFKIIDEPQFAHNKSIGFRFIERKAKEGKLYYFHSEAYEYCVSNVSAKEIEDRLIKYEKIGGKDGTGNIDMFDASVFAVRRMIDNLKEGNLT